MWLIRNDRRKQAEKSMQRKHRAGYIKMRRDFVNYAMPILCKIESLEICIRVCAILAHRSNGESCTGEFKFNALKMQMHSSTELNIVVHAEFHTEAYSIRGLKMPNI